MATVRPSVFVGSSVEGLKIAQAIQRRLEYAADVDLWDQATFDLSSVTIEALEERAGAADFAIFVLTPDDLKIKREKPTAAVRDNVIFELGLFAGTLGRKRCFFVHERDQPIDLPSDLAGITPATFRVQQSGDLDASLGAACSQVEKAMNKLKLRRKLSADALSSIDEITAFCARITGFWWERLLPDDGGALSFVTVEPDPATNTVKMSGPAYDTVGKPTADWYTVGMSVNRSDRKLSYIWEGTHKPTPYEGFGSVRFDAAPDAFVTGNGMFFDANVAALETSRRKSTTFRRCVDPKEIEVMQGTNGPQISALVQEKLKTF